MSDQSSTDQRLSRELNVTPDAIRSAREAWTRNTTMRAVIEDAITADLKKRHVQLETVAPDQLQKLQGEISGIRFALAIVLKKEN